MLTIWRRHRTKCDHADDRYYRKCKCAVWCEGVIEGRYRRHSLKTRSWERAAEIVRDIEDGKENEARPMAFKEATEKFISNLRSENRQPDTIRKYRLLFSQLEPYGRALPDFTFEVLLKFREAWNESPATRNKKLDRLKAAFRFFHEAAWVPTNAAKQLKPAVAPKVKVKPFSPDEQALILAKPQTSRIRAFVHTLYHSGLRISDCCFLRPDDFDGNCIRRVNRKNQAEIYVPIPPYLKSELDELELRGGYYFLIGESTHLGTQTDAWRTILSDLYKSKVTGFHPHRFRHTRVVEWLAHGLTMEEISGMIGTSIKVLDKFYASFAPAR